MATEPRRRGRPPGAAKSAEQVTVEEIDGASEVVDEYRALDQLLTDLGGDESAAVTVYRYSKNTRPEYLFRCSAAEMSLDDLRDKYNGGTFRLYIAKDGQLYSRKDIAIAAPLKIGASLDTGGASTDMLGALREIGERQAQQLRDLLREMRPEPQQSVNLPELITAMGTFMAAVRPEPAAPPPPAPSAAVGMDSLLSVLMKGLELGRETAGGGGGDGGGVLGLVRDALKSPLIGNMVQAAAHAQQLQPAPQPQLPAAARIAMHAPQRAGQVPVSVPVPTSQPEAEINAMQAGYLAQLVKKAKDGADPELYADVILDNVPEDQIRKLIARADAIDVLATVNADVRTYRPWFEALRACLCEALQIPSQNPTFFQPAPESGINGAHAARPDAEDVPGAAS